MASTKLECVASIVLIKARDFVDTGSVLNVRDRVLENSATQRSTSTVAPLYPSGRMWGKNSTSLMDGLSVSNITKRSIPMPSPAVGGNPYSSART